MRRHSRTNKKTKTKTCTHTKTKPAGSRQERWMWLVKIMQIVFERNINSLVAKSFFFASDLLVFPFFASFRNRNNKTFLLLFLLFNPLSFQLSNRLNFLSFQSLKVKSFDILDFSSFFFSSLDFPTHHLKRIYFANNFRKGVQT